jgi:hypothetical protein
MSAEVGQSASAGTLVCQNGGYPQAPFSRPWRGEAYDEHKEAFFQIVRQNRYNGCPTRLSEAVRYVYGEDYSNAEYKRLSRFAKRSDWFNTSSTAGFVVVEPTPACFKSTRFKTQKALAKKAGRQGDAAVKEKTGDETVAAADEATLPTADEGEITAASYPKDRVRNCVEKRGPRLDGPADATDYRDEILSELTAYREAIKDKFNYFSHSYRDKHLLKEYITRFNDEGRAKKSQRRFRERLTTAAERYDEAACVTLTVDPTRFDSHRKAVDEFSDAVSRFLSWLPHQLGISPAQVSARDFQKNGLPHIHIALFGVRPVDDGQSETGEATLSKAEVRDYWDTTAGISSQVRVQPVTRRNESWLLHRDDDGKVSLSYYLGKRMRELADYAAADADEAADMAEADDEDSLWRHALFWVYEKRYTSGSDSLLSDADEGDTDDGRGLPHVSVWQYEGTACFNQIPQQVIDTAIICRRGQPPPGISSSTDETGAKG